MDGVEIIQLNRRKIQIFLRIDKSQTYTPEE